MRSVEAALQHFKFQASLDRLFLSVPFKGVVKLCLAFVTDERMSMEQQ